MRAEILLSAAAGIIVAGIGLLHAIYTLQDVRRPRYLAPVDTSAKDAMERTTVRITRGRTSTWDVWLGVNITHGLGLFLFGAAALCLPAIVRPEHVTVVLAALTLLAIAYLATAVRFFFYIPAAALAVVTLLLVSALAVHLATAR